MASLTNGFKYDVFLSFKAEDTVSDFARSLYNALNNRGICTFMDDNKKRENGEKLFKTIEESKTAIIVLSKNYASSLSCLEQLASILDCMKRKRRLVWPVFYNVDPSSLHRKTRTGKLMGVYKAWSNHYKNRLKKTKEALHQVADLSGFHLNNGDAGGELGLIERIANGISKELKLTSYPVEMQSQLKEVSSLMELGSDEVLMMGIYGTTGIMKNSIKTELARAVYNMIADQFEGSCFLYDVSENSNKHGLVHLQNMLLSKMGEEDIWLRNAYKGVSIIKQKLHKKKVLLVLDDVDTLEQMEFLVGRTDWFGSASRVIITTSDKHLLAFHGIERRYEVQELTCGSVLCADSWYLPRLVPRACSIERIRKAKFDALEKDTQSIFLDIVCCFKGYELTEVQNILCAHHGYNVKDQTEVLIYKSMISISDGKVIIDNLIEEMAKELVRRESPEPGKCSRLWLPEDIIYVLKENTGSSKIEIIHLDIPSTEDEEVIECDEEAFKNMTNLKTLIIRRCHFSKAPKHLPNSLRVLEWKTYPSEDLPSNFDTKQLNICKLLNMDFMSPMLDELLKESTLQSAVELVSQTSNWDFRTLLTSRRIFNANIMWRLVGIVSSVIGLLCNALSPSFNRLFGRWNILKFFFYGAFSLAILSTILFTKQFSVSPSTHYAQLKTYISFAILIIISVYSIYYDKAVNGKPGILSLVSNAAFALMSLSLSKLLKFGFEMGIFAYFLGCFAIQLWTIHRMLILVAIIFGCPLFVMHSSSHSQEEFDNRDQIIDESSGSDPEVGNAGKPDVGNGSGVIIDSYLDSQQEASRNGHVIHGSSSDTIPEVAGSQDDVDIILEANSTKIIDESSGSDPEVGNAGKPDVGTSVLAL